MRWEEKWRTSTYYIHTILWWKQWKWTWTKELPEWTTTRQEWLRRTKCEKFVNLPYVIKSAVLLHSRARDICWKFHHQPSVSIHYYYLRVLCGLISNSPVLRELWLSVMINYCIHRPLTCNSHVLDNRFGHHSIELNSVWTMTSVPIHTIFTTPLQKFNLIRPHHNSTTNAWIHHVEVQL